MAEKIKFVIQMTGALLALVSIAFIFGLAGSVELNIMSFKDSLPQFITYLAVAGFGALLTNIRKGEQE